MNKQLSKIITDSFSIYEDWKSVQKIKTQEELEVFFGSSNIGEVINISEIESIFEEKNINYSLNNIKVYLYHYFVHNFFIINLRKIEQVGLSDLIPKKEVDELFNSALDLKSLLLNVLESPNEASNKIFSRNHETKFSVYFEVDKMVENFMITCFLFYKRFVNIDK